MVQAILLFAAIVFIIILIARQKASAVYDAVIVRLTREWYAVVINSVAEGSHILDIGVGTATALASQSELIAAKNLQFIGIDYEPAYIEAAKKICSQKEQLRNRIKLYCTSVYDTETLNTLKPNGQGFDAIYFSGSLTLMPDPVAALKFVATLLKVPNGTIHITQTYQRRVPPLLPTLKPLLKYITTIDFGQLTTEHQILAIFQASGLSIQQHSPISTSVNTQWQAAYHSVLQLPSSLVHKTNLK
mmetsp:Transcript_21778/g.28199  ORF Transcript_21778/g.28199 Transcript_21778/m.28199 type:complete len:245 (-) Transcript_21778:566-1300(-)